MANPSTEAKDELERRARQAGVRNFEIQVWKHQKKAGYYLAVAIDPNTGKPIPQIDPVEFHATAADYCMKLT